MMQCHFEGRGTMTEKSPEQLEVPRNY